MTVVRNVNEFFLSNGLVAGVPTIAGGPTFGAMVLGTTAASNGPGYNVPFAMRFSLTQMQNYAEFLTIFDYYRLNWVKVYITYQHNVSTASGTSTLPTLFVVPDFDDAIPEGAGALRERMGLRIKPFSADKRTRAFKIRPRRKIGVMREDTTLAPLAVNTAGWLDLSNADVPHYGYKGYIANVALPATGGDPVSTSFRIDIQMSVSFRGVR